MQLCGAWTTITAHCVAFAAAAVWRPARSGSQTRKEQRDAQPPPFAAIAGGHRGRRMRGLGLPIARARQCLLQRPRVGSLRWRALLQSKRRAAEGRWSLSQMAVGRAWRAVAQELPEPVPAGPPARAV